ncbi:uncharacterized protein LOC118356198 isoform X1 [Zalophus californianus]|uniref:Uncharacterized protein LOC118356198 isoform X1 n=1 Tax=Zalophus californianus TaxID=9704 RepID=A0A6P9F150_ZALCA|nr:uncharacterized protein LOC118356198 isoform X1 [Zalophus californianus]
MWAREESGRPPPKEKMGRDTPLEEKVVRGTCQREASPRRPPPPHRILDSPDARPPEEDRIQGSQERTGKGSSAEVLPPLEPKPALVWPAPLPQQMTPGPQPGSAHGRALAGRHQHEDCHPPLWSPSPWTWCGLWEALSTRSTMVELVRMNSAESAGRPRAPARALLRGCPLQQCLGAHTSSVHLRPWRSSKARSFWRPPGCSPPPIPPLFTNKDSVTSI